MSAQAVILAGGRGTRLSALYGDRPKALAPVAGRPFLERQLAWLARGGVTRVHLAAGHLADHIEAWLNQQAAPRPPSSEHWTLDVGRWALDVGRWALDVTLSREPAPLGTGGGLKHVEPWLETDPFIVLNGDSLLPGLDFPRFGKNEADFSKVWKNGVEKFPMFGKNDPYFSKPWKKTEPGFPNLGNLEPAVLAVTRIEAAGRYGTVEFDADGRVTAFREKAHHEGGWVNGGVYRMTKALLTEIEPGRNLSLETEIFPALAARGLLRVFPAPPPLLDMGTPEGLAAMDRFFGE